MLSRYSLFLFLPSPLQSTKQPSLFGRSTSRRLHITPSSAISRSHREQKVNPRQPLKNNNNSVNATKTIPRLARRHATNTSPPSEIQHTQKKRPIPTQRGPGPRQLTRLRVTNRKWELDRLICAEKQTYTPQTSGQPPDRQKSHQSCRIWSSQEYMQACITAHIGRHATGN